jgi:hypothetical protein
MNLSADRLARAREVFAANVFVDTLDIIQPAGRTIADRGNAPTTSTTFAADVPCRVGTTQQAASEGEVAGQIKSRVRGSVYIPYDSALPNAGMWVVITSQNNRRGEIVGVRPVSNMLGLLLEVLFL